MTYCICFRNIISEKKNLKKIFQLKTMKMKKKNHMMIIY